MDYDRMRQVARNAVCIWKEPLKNAEDDGFEMEAQALADHVLRKVGAAEWLNENRRLRTQLFEAQRAVAWLLWQSPGRSITVNPLTLREFPANAVLVSEVDPGGGIRLWLRDNA